MHSVWFGEFMGTLVLVLLGNGVCAGVTLRKSYAADAGWMVITTGWRWVCCAACWWRRPLAALAPI